MSAVVSAIGDAIGGIVEAVGDAVEAVGDVVGDIGKAIDDYVIQPILDDPLTAVATVAGAAILGPMMAPSLGAFGAGAGAVGAGLGAAAGNTGAGLVQGEDFDEAIKGGVMAGVTAGITQGAFDYFGGPSVPGGSAAVPDEALAAAADDPIGQFLAKNNNFADVDVGLPGGTGATTYAVPPPPSLTPQPLSLLDDSLTTLDDAAVAAPKVSTPSPLTTAPASQTFPLTNAAEAAPRNYLTEGLDDSFGKLKVPKFDTNAALPRDLYGNIDYSLTAGMKSTGPGLQMPSATGGPGLNIDVAAIPDFKYSMDSLDPSIRGMGDTWVGESGKLYGVGRPEGTISQYGFTPEPKTIQYAQQTPPVRSLGDKLKSFDLADVNSSDLTGVAGKVLDYAIENPLTTLAGITLVGGALTQSPPPSAQPQPGRTRDPNFTRPMDIYNYYRDQQNYDDDIYRYAQAGGEHQFFTPSRFELVTPPPVTTPAARGGLMKFANGGQMPMSAMGPLQQAMQTGNMPPAGGQGRGLPSGPMQGMPQGRAQPQGMQGMPQGRAQPTNRNRKTAYYQYGTPPAKMAMGGALNMVRSYNVGGGADGRSDDVNAVLSDGEYVFDAETVALLGNGSSEAGADRLDQMREQIRKQKGQNLAKGKISPDARSPLSYLKRS
jgi:hypothetical protein